MDYKYKKTYCRHHSSEKAEVFRSCTCGRPQVVWKDYYIGTTRKSVNYVSDPMNFNKNQILAEMNINALLEGEKPKLLDEWQVIPQLWDAVRFAVDHSKGIGQLS